MRKPIVIVAGYWVRYPLGGHVLGLLHFLIGLQQLGCDVVFVEHFGWPSACYNAQTNTMSDDPSYGLGETQRDLQRFHLEKWCYIDAAGVYHGLSRDAVRKLCRDSDLLLSLASTTWLDEFRECRTRAYVDTDPGFTQFGMVPTAGRSCAGYASPRDFQIHFTIGTRIGQPDCPIPSLGFRWQPIRWPMVMELAPYQYLPEARFFTTVMSWRSRKTIVYNGVEYGQKDVEFMKFIDLPQRLGPIFKIALAGPNAPREKIAAAGWRIANPLQVTATPWTYRNYIAESRGEFGVSVNLEVKTRSGWFGDRNAFYLAMGKPVVIQDTGFSDSLPCGLGLLPFKNVDDVVAAIESVNANYERHCRTAREIAEEYFDSKKILTAMLQACGLEVSA
ncbi:MAG TPA: hypothetical protein VL171_17435 [Verrucomicrobiae bacterium]|nr:hypothetical protein [Verrucomicrobiae bacterium]